MRWKSTALAVVVLGLVAIVTNDSSSSYNYQARTVTLEATPHKLSVVMDEMSDNALPRGTADHVLAKAKADAKKVVLHAQRKAKEVSQKQLHHGKNKVAILTKLAKIKAEMMAHTAKRMKQTGVKLHARFLYNQTLAHELKKADHAKRALPEKGMAATTPVSAKNTETSRALQEDIQIRSKMRKSAFKLFARGSPASFGRRRASCISRSLPQVEN